MIMILKFYSLIKLLIAVLKPKSKNISFLFLSAISIIHCYLSPPEAWKKFYDEEASPDYMDKTNPSIDVAWKNKMFLYNCNFFNQQSGCIKISKDSINFMHSYCIFDKNINSDDGGSVYLKGNSNAVQHRICAYDSSVQTKHLGLFSYVSVGNSNFNYIIDGTFTRCRSTESSNYIIYLQNGNTSLCNTNSSHNECDKGAGYCLDSQTKALVNYTTIAHNIVQNSIAQ